MSFRNRIVLLVAGVAMLGTPLVTAAAEPEKVFTVFRVLVGRPATAEPALLQVLDAGSPVVMLGRGPEQDARDVLQLMNKLKATYRLAEVSVSGTSGTWLAALQETEIPMPVESIAARVTLTNFDESNAIYAVTIRREGEPPSSSKLLIARGERGLVGTRDGAGAPYVFLAIEPLKRFAKGEATPPAVMPRLVHRVAPTFPEEARKAGIDGFVILVARVGADGAVGDLKVLRSEPMGLTDAAKAAVSQWRYEPARDASGKAVETPMTITISFSLNRQAVKPVQR